MENSLNQIRLSNSSISFLKSILNDVINILTTYLLSTYYLSVDITYTCILTIVYSIVKVRFLLSLKLKWRNATNRWKVMSTTKLKFTYIWSLTAFLIHYLFEKRSDWFRKYLINSLYGILNGCEGCPLYTSYVHQLRLKNTISIPSCLFCQNPV